MDFTRTAGRATGTKQLLAGVALIGATLLASGCSCTTCNTIGCANPNYGKKSPSMLHAVMAPGSPTGAATNAVSTTTSVIASQAR